MSTTQTDQRVLTVADVVPVAWDVVTVHLQDAAGGELETWSPGAHIRCELPSGKVRPFSLCGSPDDPTTYVIAVQRRGNGRGGSREIHDDGLFGQSVGVRGPYNSFPLDPARGYLFVADGIGVAPFLPMAHMCSAVGAPWQAVLCSDDPAGVAFVDELRRLPGGMVTSAPAAGAGYLDMVVRRLPVGHDVYCCGSRALVDVVRQLCRRHHGDLVVRTESCPG